MVSPLTASGTHRTARSPVAWSRVVCAPGQLLGLALAARQIAGGLADALFQPRVRRPELRRHLVELLRQLADLVRGLDRHAVIELAPAEALHAEAQPLERPCHPLAEEAADCRADQDPGEREDDEEQQ